MSPTVYLNAPEVDNETCPLKWWKENETRFPALLKQATKYLGVPATSVPAERVFSAAGNIVNQKRSCLLPENVNILVFLKKMKQGKSVRPNIIQTLYCSVIKQL